jgi:hypothetical protein
MTFNKFDLDFLKSIGIRADDTPLDDERLAQPDGTIRLLEEYGIPVTRENYLDLAFAGNPPEEPLDGEIEVADTDSHDPVLGFLKANNLPLTRENYLSVAYLGNPPKELDAETEAELPDTTGGECGEPSRTTIRGIPICSECGKSTRNRNMIVCAPCRKRTRLLLTTEDKKWLREIGIAR